MLATHLVRRSNIYGRADYGRSNLGKIRRRAECKAGMEYLVALTFERDRVKTAASRRTEAKIAKHYAQMARSPWRCGTTE